MRVLIYTDGACSGNPGPGGWGVYMRAFDREGSLVKEMQIHGSSKETTNNRMELEAVYQALSAIKIANQDIQLYSDSKYVIDGIQKWIHGWKNKGWRTRSGEPVKNADLWHKIDLTACDHRIEWIWVKGHANTPGNIIADRLACKGRDEALSKIMEQEDAG